MSGRVGAARSEGEPYRCCLAPLDDTLGEDAYPLPVLYERTDLAANNTVKGVNSSQEHYGWILTRVCPRGRWE